MKKLLLGACVALLATVPVMAQDTPDPAAQPLTATLYLASGFLPDPFIIPVISAGTLEASALSEDCTGFVAAAPDIVVSYTGAGDTLRFFFYGDGDSVIAVVAPDGSVSCNDDATLEILQSDVEIANPADGDYAVFVGAYSADEQAMGVLGITEFSQADIQLRDIDLSRYLTHSSHAVVQAQNIPVASLPTSPTIYDTIDIGASFYRDTFSAAAGGGQAMTQVVYTSETPEACAGFATTLPLFTLNVTDRTPLHLSFESDADTTLIVIDAEGNAFCGDDSEDGASHNPSVDIRGADGIYTVRIGTYLPNTGTLGELTIRTDAG